jgi:hypothetical protein
MEGLMADRTPEQVIADIKYDYGIELDIFELAVVPVEPTDKMVEAMNREIYGQNSYPSDLKAAWRAAVAANEEGTDG